MMNQGLSPYLRPQDLISPMNPRSNAAAASKTQTGSGTTSANRTNERNVANAYK